MGYGVAEQLRSMKLDWRGCSWAINTCFFVQQIRTKLNVRWLNRVRTYGELRDVG